MRCVERESPSLGSSLSKRPGLWNFLLNLCSNQARLDWLMGWRDHGRAPITPFCLLTLFPTPPAPFRPALPHSRPGPALPASQGKNITGELQFPGGPVVKSPLPMQGTWIWSLVWEDPTPYRAAKPVSHNYWAHTLEPGSLNYWAACTLEPCPAAREATVTRGQRAATREQLCSPRPEKAGARQQRPSAAKNRLIKFL